MYFKKLEGIFIFMNFKFRSRTEIVSKTSLTLIFVPPNTHPHVPVPKFENIRLALIYALLLRSNRLELNLDTRCIIG